MDCQQLTGDQDYRALLSDEHILREEQELNIRHQKLLAAREALLYGTPDPDKLNRTSTLDRKNEFSAAQRNKKLLEDLRKTKAKMTRNSRFHATKAKRLSNISNNYWSMVRNLQPLWEQACKGKK
ncbi:centrosomal protein 15-like [Watersipora subatra]|uniref:centrosomal protein 15-like n=1 Tax=Watersipora subatra TaxID=2589382 RepID=UPI00355BE1E3